MNSCRSAILILALVAACGRAEAASPIIGETEQVYTLGPGSAEVRGIAWDESGERSPRLLVLDRSGAVVAYGLGSGGLLEPLDTYDLAAAVGAARLSSPRGLAFAEEDGRRVLYFMDWDGSTTRLWRYALERGTASSVDLSLYMFRIGDREGFDLAAADGGLLISYDASGHTDPNRRVQRGILRLAWDGAFGEDPASVRHLPDSGTAPARGLATMHWEGLHYLWATVGNEQIYCADGPTGRGLFFFDRPRSVRDSQSCWGICFGQGALWVSENVPGGDRVHRVNVTRNPDAADVGPRVPRRLVMTIRTEPEAAYDDPGAVYHYYSRPQANRVMPNQGIWRESEKVQDLSDAGDAVIRRVVLDPAGDKASRQMLHCVEYHPASGEGCSSRYEIELWTNPYKKFVYPHRVDRCDRPLEATDYLADDPTLYNLSDKATYDGFVQRVRRHIREKYAVEADMQNPYWAARNVVEYIQDHYYYPSRPKRKPATVDYDRGHYDANPANLKIALSEQAYDKTQIIACSGTSVMVAAAMRHVGIPARWLGTGTQRPARDWDTDGDGLLGLDETAACTNGHRYTQVWLGSRYGWICFDATPSKPDLNDYDIPPPLQSQWRYMTRAASGHREPKRIVFNVGSELIEPLYREFEYDERLAIDNNCGGDQRYNLQGRFEDCALWKSPRHGIQVRNLCFITQVQMSGRGREATFTWELEGAWQRIPEATVSLFLQKQDGNGPWQDTERLATRIAVVARSAAVDLSRHHGKRFRVILRRDGDVETGGVSGVFDLD